jgi:hypothetical protein
VRRAHRAPSTYESSRQLHVAVTSGPNVPDEFVRAVATAWSLCKAERLRELRDERGVRRFDPRGLHPFSYAWGYVEALRDVLDVPVGAAYENPWELRDAARAEADSEFRAEIAETALTRAQPGP